MSRASSPAVIAAAAIRRFPPHSVWSLSRIGQVATTMMTAQKSGGRKGLRIHTLAAISTPMKRTASVVRARSCAGGEGVKGVLLPLLTCGVRISRRFPAIPALTGTG